MTTNLRLDDQFPDFELPNHQNKPMRLSHFTKPSLLDTHLGFQDGYPLILVFFRGFFCPRDQQQMRQLVEFQRELAVNYGKSVKALMLNTSACEARYTDWYPILVGLTIEN